MRRSERGHPCRRLRWAGALLRERARRRECAFRLGAEGASVGRTADPDQRGRARCTPDLDPGDLDCILSDHINFSGLNPLIGEPTDARFVPMGPRRMIQGCAAALRSACRGRGHPADGRQSMPGIPALTSETAPRRDQGNPHAAARMGWGMSTVARCDPRPLLGLRVARDSGPSLIRPQGCFDEQISHEHTNGSSLLGPGKTGDVIQQSALLARLTPDQAKGRLQRDLDHCRRNSTGGFRRRARGPPA